MKTTGKSKPRTKRHTQTPASEPFAAFVDTHVDTQIGDFAILFAGEDEGVAMEQAFLRACNAEYAKEAVNITAEEDITTYRFLAGGAVGYRIGLMMARKVAEAGR